MSSSSSSADFSCPCPMNEFYDVFLSFRGSDTRYGFTSYLYHALKDNKIHTFMDIKLTGYDINHIFEMIGTSKVAVVIYSENFASSAWCLKELKMILQQREEKKMLMVPIFYNMNVHELQHLEGKTAEDLDKHVQEYGETTVQEWKDAVTTLGEVSGLSYKITNRRYEYDFIMDVIAKTKEKLEEWEALKSSSKRDISGHATEHDVFISFMGEDTRYGLVNPLYRALNTRKELKIFMDDRDLLKDDNIFEVIQRSKISLIVFSQNYASSKWCLRELVKILQCSNTTGQELLLIFYEIPPTDLINQAKGSKIADYLKQHELDEESETVQSWRNAITDLGYSVGWSYSTTHSSKTKLAVFIRGLVEEISTILNWAQHRQEDVGFSSTQSSFAHSMNTTTGDEEEVYRVVTSTYFQKSREFTGKLLSVKPDYLHFYVESEKESSTCLILSNNTDNCVAFMIQCTSEPLKYRICTSERLVLPHSTCQVIVTMEAQSTVFPSEYLVCSEKFLVHSVIAKNDSYNSTYDFSDMFKKESGNTIDNWLMSVVYIAPPGRISSVPDHHSQLPNKGFVFGSSVTSIDTHPRKSWLLLGLVWGSVCIWNYESRAEDMSFIVDDANVFSAKFVHKKHWIVVGTSVGFVHVFDYNTSEKVIKFKAHEDDIICVAVHPTSPYVLTTSKDKLVKLWNWENDWEYTKKFEGHSDIVRQVAFNPKDVRSFATASLDGTIKLWTFGSSVAKFTVKAHAKRLKCVEYFVGNNDKLYLLSGSDDYSVRVWDYESKTLVETLEGHSGDVQTILIHPKLPIIITGSMDKTIRIWNKNTYQLELVWRCDLGQVFSMGFIKAFDEVVLGCEDGMVIIKIVNGGICSY